MAMANLSTRLIAYVAVHAELSRENLIKSFPNVARSSDFRNYEVTTLKVNAQQSRSRPPFGSVFVSVLDYQIAGTLHPCQYIRLCSTNKGP